MDGTVLRVRSERPERCSELVKARGRLVPQCRSSRVVQQHSLARLVKMYMYVQVGMYVQTLFDSGNIQSR